MSTKYCERCDNGSHNTPDCKYKNTPGNFRNNGAIGSDLNQTMGNKHQQRSRAASRPHFNATRGHRGKPGTPGHGRVNNVAQTNNAYEREDMLSSDFVSDLENNQIDYENSLPQNLNTVDYTTQNENNIRENKVNFNNLFL